MALDDKAVAGLSRLPTGVQMAGRTSDPRFFAALSMLPNPDPILRKAGKSDEVFDAIQADSHVIGELRAIRAGLLRFKHQLVKGGDDPKSVRAYELCLSLFNRPAAPARDGVPAMSWPDTVWNMGMCAFRGFAAHEVEWERSGNELMPSAILDRPTRRFVFGSLNDLRIVTKDQPLIGVPPAFDKQFLITRHMPTYDNPYGVALFSSCFWPYMFKHAGFRWFVKFCERYALPVPIGEYEPGTGDAQIEELEEALQNLIESAFAAIPAGNTIKLLESAGTAAALPQQQLVHEANREMSKALCSQTLATEQNSTGARAAAETARDREEAVSESDRELIAYTLDQLCTWITEVNVGPDAKPPINEFGREQPGGKERAETYQIFTQTAGGASRKAMAADLNIALADPADVEDVVARSAAPPTGFSPLPPRGPNEFAAPGTQKYADQAVLDSVDLDKMLQPISQELVKPLLDEIKNGLAPDKLLERLAGLYPKLDDKGLQELLARLMFVADVWARLVVDGQVAGTGDQAAA